MPKDGTSRLKVLGGLGGMEVGRKQHFTVAQVRFPEPEECAGRPMILHILRNKRVCVSHIRTEIDLGLGVEPLRSDGHHQINTDNRRVEIKYGPGNLCFDGQTVTLRE